MKILTLSGRLLLGTAPAEELARFKSLCAALAEVRDRSLYSAEYADFDSFVKANAQPIMEIANLTGFSVNEIIDFGCQLIQGDN